MDGAAFSPFPGVVACGCSPRRMTRNMGEPAKIDAVETAEDKEKNDCGHRTVSSYNEDGVYERHGESALLYSETNVMNM